MGSASEEKDITYKRNLIEYPNHYTDINDTTDSVIQLKDQVEVTKSTTTSMKKQTHFMESLFENSKEETC